MSSLRDCFKHTNFAKGWKKMHRIDFREKKLLSVALSLGLVLSPISSLPVMATEKTVATEETTAAPARDVTFTVSEGDLLIATNPRAWEYTENATPENPEMESWEESVGKLESPGMTLESSESKGRTVYPLENEDSAYPGSDCDSLRVMEEEREYWKAHPELYKKAVLSSDPAEEYKPGDWIWHGYNKWDSSGKLSAEELMEGATIYSGNEAYSGEEITTPAQWGEDANQVYRKYVCLVADEQCTIWTYVAGSETDKKPAENAMRGHVDKQDPLPTYLSANRAEKISKELSDIHFMERLTASAGDFSLTDSLGDNDGKIAFFFEPIRSNILGYSLFSDQVKEHMEYFDPAFPLDCLHIQLQSTIGEMHDEIDGESYRRYYTYTPVSGAAPYSTMAHELTHYIISGYMYSRDDYYDDVWLNEMFAQSVMMQVIPWTKYGADGDLDKAIGDDLENIINVLEGNHMLTEYASPMNSGNNSTYPVSTLLGGYLTGRMGIDLWKRAIRGNAVNEETLSDFLASQEGGLGHGLRWWRAAFSIALLQNVNADIYRNTESEFALDPDTSKFEDAASREVAVTHKFATDYICKNIGKPSNALFIHPASELLGDVCLKGGGSAIVYRVGSDIIPSGKVHTDITLKGVGEDIVWAHKDSATGVIEVDGMPSDSEKKQQPREKAVLNPDGTWTYSDAQEAALAQTQRPTLSHHLAKTGAEVKVDLSAREAVSFNKNKRALAESLVDLDKSKVSINGTDVKIKKVVLKNPKKAYVSGDSVFKDIISARNAEAYGRFADKKKPAYYLVLDTAGIPADVKKAAKEANKYFKKNPVPVEILPVCFNRGNITVDHDFANGKKCKVTVVFEDGSNQKLKYSKKGKKDFIFTPSENSVLIEGTNNYNGSVLCAPTGNLSFSL